MSDRLPNAFEGAVDRVRERKRKYGLLGRHNADATVTFAVPGRANYLFVTIRNANGAQTVTPARNDAGVAHSPDLPVEMRVENGTTYVIVGRTARDDLATVAPSPSTGVPAHTHVHAGLTLLTADDHTQYHNDTRGDARYFTEVEHLNVSAGAADAGKPIKLAADGFVDLTMLDPDDLLSGGVTAANVGAAIDGTTAKTTPVDADWLAGIDSAAGNILTRFTWANIKATLLAYFSTLFAVLLGTAGGQSLSGGTAANDDLTLQGTTHATRTTSYVLLQPTEGNVGIGLSDPAHNLDVLGDIRARGNDLYLGTNGARLASDNDNFYFVTSATGTVIHFNVGGTYRANLTAEGLAINNGTTFAPPGTGLLVASGDAWFAANVSALSFTDRTEGYEGDALTELKGVKTKNGELDHDTLPQFARAEVVGKDGDIEAGRDLGAMISMLTVAVQQLAAEVDALKGAKSALLGPPVP